MRIAVIGGGLFGATAATIAARAGHEVHLFEPKHDLMMGATAATYCRLHRGYHYPRSPETGRESRRAEASFRREFGAAVVEAGQQFYIVAGGLERWEYAAFLDAEGLEFCEDGHFEVREPRINLAILQRLVRSKVYEASVHLHLGETMPVSDRDHFDRIVIATYSRLNWVLLTLGVAPAAYKFQVVERPVAKLPAAFRDTSIVVIDGPYGCLDPLDATDCHVLGHVVHTIHASNTGFEADIPVDLIGYIDRGLIAQPACTRFHDVVHGLAQYVPGISDARHIGSSFTVRAVLADQEATDARPTLVRRHSEQVISIFSGKLGTAVRAANEVLALIEARERAAA